MGDLIIKLMKLLNPHSVDSVLYFLLEIKAAVCYHMLDLDVWQFTRGRIPSTVRFFLNLTNKWAIDFLKIFELLRFISFVFREFFSSSDQKTKLNNNDKRKRTKSNSPFHNEYWSAPLWYRCAETRIVPKWFVIQKEKYNGGAIILFQIVVLVNTFNDIPGDLYFFGEFS